MSSTDTQDNIMDNEENNDIAEIISTESCEEQPPALVQNNTPVLKSGPAINENIKHVITIYNGMSEAQAAKGGLSMADCKAISTARTTFITAFAGETTVYSDELLQAAMVFRKVCEYFQEKGCFSIQGSVIVSDSLDALDAEIRSKQPVENKSQTQTSVLANNRRPQPQRQLAAKPHPVKQPPGKNKAKYNNKK